MELKRLLLSKKLFMCVLVLMIASCGFYIREQRDKTDYDFSKYCNLKNETISMYKDYPAAQAGELIGSRIAMMDVLFQLDGYSDFKADDPDYYLEYMAEEEKEYREEHPDEASIYDEDPEKYSSDSYLMMYGVLLDVKNQIDYVDTYNEFLENIKVQAENMSSVSIFSKENSFSSKNIAKTVEAYRGLEGIDTALGMDEPVTTVMDFELSHYFMLIFIILLVIQLLSERRQGLWSIVHATPSGRIRLAARRLGIVALIIFLVETLMYSSLFAVSFRCYGGVSDVFRNIQSIEMFQNFTIKMPVWEFILVYVAVNIISGILVAYFIWSIMLVITNSVMAFLSLGVIGAAEYAMYTFIPIQSQFSVFKCINLFAFINPTDTLINYTNINLFSMAVNRRNLCMTVLVLLLIISAAICIIINCKKKPIQSPGKFELVVVKIADRVICFYRKLVERLSPIGYELYKILILQKGLLVFIVLVWYLAGTINTSTIYYNKTDTYMNMFYENYSGVPEKAVYEYLEELDKELTAVDEEYNEAVSKYEEGQITYDELYTTIIKVEAYSAKRQAYEKIKNKTDYLQKLNEEQGIKGWLLNDAGYNYLFDGKAKNLNNLHALISVFAVSILLSGILAYEKKSGTIRLIRSVSGGRFIMYRRKLITSFIVVGIIWATVYGIEIYNVWQMYGLECFEAPVQSLDYMYSFPLKINIGTYMFLIYLVRLIELIALCGIIFAISSVLGYEASMMVSAAVLAVPGVLYVVGINIFGYISVLEPLGIVNLILKAEDSFWWIAPILFVIVLGVAGYIGSAYKWCVTGRRKNVRD